MRVGAIWLVIAQWARANRQLFGNCWISTPAGFLDEAAARSFATMRSKGPADVAPWRRAIPEPMVTFPKDLRLLLKSRFGEVPIPERADVAFVLQHHQIFHDRGFKLAQRLDVPIVLGVDALQVREATGWGVHRPGWGRLIEKYGEHSLIRRADAILTPSAESAALLSELVDPRTVVVVGNKADISSFDGPNRSESRARLNVESSFVVGWVGSFRNFHALDVVLAGFEALLSAVPEAVLVLVGDGPERSMCEDFAARVGTDRVRFTGMIPFEEVPSIAASFDVAVIGGRAGEQFHYSPLKLQEYLAAGVPVVAPALGEAKEILGDGAAGRLYEPGDIEDLAAQLANLAANDEHRQVMARAARQRALEFPSMVDEMQKVCDVIGVTTSSVT